MLLTWRATVLSLMPRFSAIARFVFPDATRRSTSTSRAVTPPTCLRSRLPHTSCIRHESTTPPTCPRRLRLVHAQPACRQRGLYLPLGQPQKAQPGLRSPPPIAGLTVSVLGLREVAAEPLQLRLLVEGRTHRRLAGEPFAGPLR